MQAREEIPDPKKPRNLDLIGLLVVACIFMIGMVAFAFTEMKFNQAVCAYGMILFQILWGISWVWIRPKRNRKYRDEIRERQNLRDTVRGRARLRSRVSGQPWPSPQHVSTRGWDTQDSRGFKI